MLTEREKLRRGNGQGNFTRKGRRTGPLRKIIDLEIKAIMRENMRKKRHLLVQKFLSFRETKKFNSSKI